MKKTLGKLSVAIYTHKLWLIGASVWLLLMTPLSIYIGKNIEYERSQKVTPVTTQKTPESSNPQDTTPKIINPTPSSQETSQTTPKTNKTNNSVPSAAITPPPPPPVATYTPKPYVRECLEYERTSVVNGYNQWLDIARTRYETEMNGYRSRYPNENSSSPGWIEYSNEIIRINNIMLSVEKEKINQRLIEMNCPTF